MKKAYLAIIVVISVVCGLANIAQSITYGVTYSAHNLGTGGQGNFGGSGGVTGVTTSEVCAFCHTPHNANHTNGKSFLWSRSNPTTSYALYTASPTLNFKSGSYGSLSEISKMCMSCHDGVTALNSMANPTAGMDTMDVNMNQIGDIINPDFFGPDYHASNIGEGTGSTYSGGEGGGGNLTNDHPVSFTYSASYSDPTIKQSADGGLTINGLPLFSGKVECVTCHEPHVNYGYWSYRNGSQHGMGGDITLAPFLRISNTGSQMCFACHNK